MACWLAMPARRAAAYMSGRVAGFPPFVENQRGHPLESAVCKDAHAWAKGIRVAAQFAFIQDPEAARHQLEADLSVLYSILGHPIDPDSPSFAEVTFYRCGGKASFVTIEDFVALVPDQVPLPREAMFENADYFGQVDEPVVELLNS